MAEKAQQGLSRGVWIFVGIAAVLMVGGGLYWFFGGGPSEKPKSAAVKHVEKLEAEGNVGAFAQEAARQDNAEAAQAAVRSMGNIARSGKSVSEVQPHLERAVEHPKAEVRMEAAAQIGSLATEQKLEKPPAALARLALDDQDDNVRAAAMQAVGQMRTPDSLDVLVEGLIDPDVQVRRFAIESLQLTIGYRVKPGAYNPESTPAESRDFYNQMKAQIDGTKQYLKQVRRK